MADKNTSTEKTLIETTKQKLELILHTYITVDFDFIFIAPPFHQSHILFLNDSFQKKTQFSFWEA